MKFPDSIVELSSFDRDDTHANVNWYRVAAITTELIVFGLRGLAAYNTMSNATCRGQPIHALEALCGKLTVDSVLGFYEPLASDSSNTGIWYSVVCDDLRLLRRVP